MEKEAIGLLIEGVRKNCNISDAKYWGFYSMCDFLLRLRELYKFQKGIEPWQKIDEKDISVWIEERQRLWADMEEVEFSPLGIGEKEYGYFDWSGINKELKGLGFLYGAGIGLSMKPVFFLGELESHEGVEGCDVYISGREYVRDLSIHPAMLQGKTIFVRRHITRLLLWEKFDELRAGRKGSLSIAFSSYGVNADCPEPELIDSALEKVTDFELQAYIRHEIGEAFESERTDGFLINMLTHTGGRVSSFISAVKDTLADTSDKGMLRFIINERNMGSLAFYISSLKGYRAKLSAVIESAFRRFIENKDWEIIDSARRHCYEKTIVLAQRLIDIYLQRKDDYSSVIEEGFLSPQCF